MRIQLRDAETKGMNDALKRQLNENVPALRLLRSLNSVREPSSCHVSLILPCFCVILGSSSFFN